MPGRRSGINRRKTFGNRRKRNRRVRAMSRRSPGNKRKGTDRRKKQIGSKIDSKNISLRGLRSMKSEQFVDLDKPKPEVFAVSNGKVFYRDRRSGKERRRKRRRKADKK